MARHRSQPKGPRHNVVLLAIDLKSELGIRIVKIRCEALRFEVHAPRHVLAPKVHGLAKNSKGSPGAAQMSRK